VENFRYGSIATELLSLERRPMSAVPPITTKILQRLDWSLRANHGRAHPQQKQQAISPLECGADAAPSISQLTVRFS
jgi:hypothetical protein